MSSTLTDTLPPKIIPLGNNIIIKQDRRNAGDATTQAKVMAINVNCPVRCGDTVYFLQQRARKLDETLSFIDNEDIIAYIRNQDETIPVNTQSA